MSLVLNGSGTITGLSAGGLPDATITQAEIGTNVAGTGPAFSAYSNSAQSVPNSVGTAIAVDTEDFDTASCYNPTGSTVGGIPAYSFLPTIAGYYQVTGNVVFASGTSGEVFCSIYKNGSRFLDGSFTYYATSPSDVVSATSTGLVYLNGSSDYITLYGSQSSGSSKTTFTGSRATRFQGALIRAA